MFVFVCWSIAWPCQIRNLWNGCFVVILFFYNIFLSSLNSLLFIVVVWWVYLMLVINDSAVDCLFFGVLSLVALLSHETHYRQNNCVREEIGHIQWLGLEHWDGIFPQNQTRDRQGEHPAGRPEACTRFFQVSFSHFCWVNMALFLELLLYVSLCHLENVVDRRLVFDVVRAHFRIWLDFVDDGVHHLCLASFLFCLCSEPGRFFLFQ